MALTDKLAAIADAIRGKTGGTEGLTLDQMPAQIAGIQTGAALNFEVVGGTSEPSNPSENTIWINTDTAITGWVFSAEQQENLAEGMVWIFTGTTSPAEFNALKKNSVQVYPLFARQYVSGALVSKDAKIYQSGEWGELETGVIIKNGNLIRNLNASARAGDGATVIQCSGYVELKNPINVSTAKVVDMPIDLTNYTKLTLYTNVIKVYLAGGSPAVGPVVASALNAGSYSGLYENIVAGKYTKYTGEQTLVCDISSLSGEYYVGILLDGGDEGYPELQVYDLYLS